jgi:hypothetical protein
VKSAASQRRHRARSASHATSAGSGRGASTARGLAASIRRVACPGGIAKWRRVARVRFASRTARDASIVSARGQHDATGRGGAGRDEFPHRCCTNEPVDGVGPSQWCAAGGGCTRARHKSTARRGQHRGATVCVCQRVAQQRRCVACCHTRLLWSQATRRLALLGR